MFLFLKFCTTNEDVVGLDKIKNCYCIFGCYAVEMIVSVTMKIMGRVSKTLLRISWIMEIPSTCEKQASTRIRKVLSNFKDFTSEYFSQVNEYKSIQKKKDAKLIWTGIRIEKETVDQIKSIIQECRNIDSSNIINILKLKLKL